MAWPEGVNAAAACVGLASWLPQLDVPNKNRLCCSCTDACAWWPALCRLRIPQLVQREARTVHGYAVLGLTPTAVARMALAWVSVSAAPRARSFGRPCPSSHLDLAKATRSWALPLLASWGFTTLAAGTWATPCPNGRRCPGRVACALRADSCIFTSGLSQGWFAATSARSP